MMSFSEGATEEKVLACLGKMLDENITQINSRGKDQLNKKLTDTIGPLLGQQALRCLILRDLDAHEGETLERIVQSVTTALRRLFQQRGFDVTLALDLHPDYAHVFTLQINPPDLRLVLHIANFRWNEQFIKSTIDDYILALALEPNTVARLAEQSRIPRDKLFYKITHEIPTLMRNNGILLTEAKDYVRLYAAVIRSHTSPPVFAEKTLAIAEEEAIRISFASLLTALEFLKS